MDEKAAGLRAARLDELVELWALLGRVKQVAIRRSRQRVWAWMEASPWSPLLVTHALVFVVLTQTVLKVLGVKITKTDAVEVGSDSLAQLIEARTPRSLGPIRMSRTVKHTVESGTRARTTDGEGHPIRCLAERRNILEVRDDLSGYKTAAEAVTLV